MKKNVISKILAGALAATMVLGMAACGDNTQNPSDGSGSGSGSGSDSGNVSDSGNSGSGSESGNEGGDQAQAPMKLTFSLPAVNTNHAEQDNTYDKLVADLNAYLNADITWEWGASDTYYGQLGLKYAANDVADVLAVGLDGAFYSAATGGSYKVTETVLDADGNPVMQDVLDADGNPVLDDEGNVKQEVVTEENEYTVTEPIFWDLTDYLKDYDNLATIPDSVLAENSYNGRVYGLPRSRQFARLGWAYRQDWLNKLGLKEPETWEDFANMCYEFTYNDPDGNGVNDTVGLALDSWNDVWDVMAAWFGVPNTWGIDENGDLIYKAMTDEYMAALDAFRELYSNGCINDGSQPGIPSFEDVGAGKCRQEIMNAGVGGVYVQCLDDARKIEENFANNGLYGAIVGTTDPDELVLTLKGYVLTESGNNEPHVLSFGSANNAIAISKTGNVKTEEDLRRVLQILNDFSDGECINLVEYGWEGVTYEIDENGYVYLWMGNLEGDSDGSRAKLDAAGVGSTNYRDGFNQVITYFTAEANARPVTTSPGENAIRILENRLYEEDKPYVVTNLGAAYTSQTYVNNAAALDAIINDSRLAYIKGEIDRAALESEIQRWWTAGGEQVTKEMNDLFHAND